MTTTLEKPVSTSKDELPSAVTDFVHKGIEAKTAKQLRAWKRESEKIMKNARLREAVGEQNAARKTRQA